MLVFAKKALNEEQYKRIKYDFERATIYRARYKYNELFNRYFDKLYYRLRDLKGYYEDNEYVHIDICIDGVMNILKTLVYSNDLPTNTTKALDRLWNYYFKIYQDL